MDDVVFFLQKDVWTYLNTKGKSILRGQVCNAMAKSEIHTDMTKEEVGDDEYLFQVWNDSGGRIKFDFSAEEEYLNSSKAAPLCSTYLVEKDTTFCEKKQLQQGVVVLNEDLLGKDPLFFALKEGYISKGKDVKYSKGWEEKEFYSVIGGHYCNALILMDKYICKEGSVSRMNKNLKPLLKVLLPERMDIPFQLSIFSEFDQTKGKQIYQDIIDTIKEIRTELDFQLTLYHTHEIHDRLILTNAYMIEVGAGFALFKNGVAANETTVRYCPYKKPDYYQRLKSVARISRKSETNENFANHWGNKQNRLFELVD